MRGGWGCAWNSPCGWLLLAPPPEAPLRATVIRLSGLDRGARFAGAGWEAGLARRVRTDSAPPHFVTQAPWGRPPSATTDRCPCRSPLGLRFRVTARGVLGKSSGSFCFEPGPDLSHGEEETGILLGCEDGIRGSAFLGFGVPSHWRESQAKGSCACTAGVDHACVGGSLRGCPGRRSLCGLRLRGPAPQRPDVRCPVQDQLGAPTLPRAFGGCAPSSPQFPGSGGRLRMTHAL